MKKRPQTVYSGTTAEIEAQKAPPYLDDRIYICWNPNKMTRLLVSAVLLTILVIGVPSCEAGRSPLAGRKATGARAGGRQQVALSPTTPPPPPPHPAFSEVCQKFNFTTYKRVTSNQELRAALKNAQPGDMIEVMPGSYWIRTPGGGGGAGTLLPDIPQDDSTVEPDVPDVDPSPSSVPAKPAQGGGTEASPPPPSPSPSPSPPTAAAPKPAAKPKPAAAPAQKPKPAPALKPKPAPAQKPKPAPAQKPKPAPAQKPKPAPGPKPPKPAPVPSSSSPSPAPAPEVEPVSASAPAPAPIAASSAAEDLIAEQANADLDTYSSDVQTTVMSIKSEDPPAGLTPGGDNAPVLANAGTIYQKHGAPGNLITLCGTPENTTFEGTGDVPNSWRGYSIRVVSSSYIRVAGFNLANALKGIDVQNTTNSEFMYLNTNNTMQEGMRLRYNSTNNTVEYNNISYTGRLWAGWGEGIYVGTSKKNSIEYNLPEDHSDYNAFRYNRFGAGVLAENIDVKEFTTGGKIVDNRFNGSEIQNINGAMSWVSLKGNNWTVYNNTGTGLLNVGAGYRVIVQWEGQGQSNRLLENKCYNLDELSYCVYVQPDAANTVVACTNEVRFWPGANSTVIDPPECNCVRDCSVISYYKPGATTGATTTTASPSPAPVAPSRTGVVANQVMGSVVEEPQFADSPTDYTGAPVVTASWSVPGLDASANDERRPRWD